jgi:hypothetical protein
MSEPLVIEHGSSGPGRWLRQRRWRIALGIAVVEALVVAVSSHVSNWTVLLLAALAVALYYFVGRESRSGIVHELTWILGASQLLALIAAILALFVIWFAFIVAAIFAVVALSVFFLDRR